VSEAMSEGLAAARLGLGEASANSLAVADGPDPTHPAATTMSSPMPTILRTLTPPQSASRLHPRRAGGATSPSHTYPFDSPRQVVLNPQLHSGASVAEIAEIAEIAGEDPFRFSSPNLGGSTIRALAQWCGCRDGLDCLGSRAHVADLFARSGCTRAFCTKRRPLSAESAPGCAAALMALVS